MTDPTDQHECFQRAFSSLTRILGKLPRRSPILEIAPSQARLTVEFFRDGLPKNKMHLVDIAYPVFPLTDHGTTDCHIF
ncbi:hypothetical protein CsatB_019033 [Cannabis sativa]